MKKQHWYSRSRSVPATPRGLPADAIANGTGCMSMVHYLIFAPGAGCVGRPPSDHDHHAAVALSSSSPANHKKGGLEAPRNSLELEGDELRDIQIGVQVEPAFDALLAVAGRRSTGSRATAPSSEAGTPRTPSLVARLMGIDGLPHDASPSPSLNKNNNPRAVAVSVKEKKKRVIPESMNRQPLRSLSCNTEARSLPDTPRASASSARSASAWDVVDRPRLSLQVLRENVLDRAAQYMSMPTSPTSASKKKKKDRDRKDGHRRRDAKEHAREIVRQAKETVTNRKNSKKPPSTGAGAGSNKENASPLVVVEDKRMVLVQVPASVKPTAPLSVKVQVDQQQPHAPRLPPPPPPLRAKPSRPPPPPPPPDHPTPPRAAPLSPQAVKCKRPPDGCERFATRIKKPAGAGAGAATIQQAAPAAPPCPAPAVPVSISTGHQRNHHPGVASTSSPRVPVPLKDDPEYGYLRSVLERGGFMRTTPAPSHRQFKSNSVSSPVDPIVFHLLELDRPTDDSPRLGPLRHRWNRKLLFHLTQEILADLLPLDGASSGSATPAPHGPALLGKLWARVKAFPAADCRVVGDIDELVAGDLHASNLRGLERHPAVAEEAGDVAEDVAEWVLDALLRESLPPSWSWSPARAPRL
ncbi:unnamed protein product [Alopecurus aequalis]